MSSPGIAAKAPVSNTSVSLMLKRAFPLVMAAVIWFWPVPAGLTPQSWHLFAIFATAIVSVLLSLYTLLTSTMLAAGAVVLTDTISAEKAFAGFANSSVLLVVVAFLVAQAVVKCGLGQRIGLFMVSLFGRSSLGLAYSIVLTDAAIAPAFPSNTARGGVLFPIVLSVAQGSGSHPDDPKGRRLGGYLMFCGMASLAVSSALWMTATSANPDLNSGGAKIWSERRLREVADCLVGTGSHLHPRVAVAGGALVPAGCRFDTGGARGCAQSTRRIGTAVTR